MLNSNEIFFFSSSNDVLNLKIIIEENTHNLYYQTFEDDDSNQTDSNNLLSDQALTKPVAIKLNDDCLCLFHKDLNHNIIIHKYSNNTWTSNTLIQNDSKDLIFVPIKFNDKILLFIQNYNETKKMSYLFYQTLDIDSSLSAPTLIDKINFKNNLLEVKTLNDAIYIFYLKFELDYLVGFKKLDFTNKKLFSFQTLSSSKNLYFNYSVIANEDTFSIQYQKEDPAILSEENTNKENDSITNETIENNLIESCISSDMPALAPNTNTNANTNALQISNLKRENFKLTNENLSLKRKLELANTKFALFFKQFSKFLQ